VCRKSMGETTWQTLSHYGTAKDFGLAFWAVCLLI
jgi:hypothetical protein